jgi:signal transduction histidine kinase
VLDPSTGTGATIVSKGENKPSETHARGRATRVPFRFRELLHKLLFLATRGVPRPEFLRQASSALLEFSGCDSVELRVEEAGKHCRARAFLDEGGEPRFEARRPVATWECEPEADVSAGVVPDRIVQAILRGELTAAAPFFTRRGSFWTGDTARPVLLREKSEGEARTRSVILRGELLSFALIRIPVDPHSVGSLHMGSRRRDFFDKEDILFYEAAAETIGAALAHQSVQWALRERVKELTCLYGIAKVAKSPAISLGDLLRAVAELLPPGWQYPEVTQGRIILDDEAYCTAGFSEIVSSQSAEIWVEGKARGLVEVAYTRELPEMDEGPFLKEERSLINEIARQVGIIVAQREADEQTARLEEQLRHADRLATIGQLAAGAAHELNEPLGSILGFAQLAKSHPGVTGDALRDLDKIETASLHAREVVRKLLTFARQMPAQKTVVDLNKLVQEGLVLVEPQCAKEGIALVYRLDPTSPAIEVDPAQISQVLVNLVVNAMQAMPAGGTITVETRAAKHDVAISVEDSGTGMSPEVIRQMFIPFFTTKGVGQGTGLGLSVVHGIVTAHGGRIDVKSEIGKGSRFEIRLPC